MIRKEFLIGIFVSSLVGTAVGTTIHKLLSPTSSPILEQLDREDREQYEKHKRATNLLFATYEKYINVDTDRDFYNYASGLIEAGQFSSYKDGTHGIVFPWVIDNPIRTPVLPNEIGLAINYPENQKYSLPNLYVDAHSDQDVTIAQKSFIALFVGRDLKMIRDVDSFENEQPPFNEEDFVHIWPHIFRDPPGTYEIREKQYTRGNLEAISEHNVRNGELVTYSIFSDGWVRVIIE